MRDGAKERGSSNRVLGPTSAWHDARHQRHQVLLLTVCEGPSLRQLHPRRPSPARDQEYVPSPSLPGPADSEQRRVGPRRSALAVASSVKPERCMASVSATHAARTRPLS